MDSVFDLRQNLSLNIFFEGQYQIAQDPIQKITKMVPRNFVGYVEDFIERDEVDKESE